MESTAPTNATLKSTTEAECFVASTSPRKAEQAARSVPIHSRNALAARITGTFATPTAGAAEDQRRKARISAWPTRCDAHNQDHRSLRRRNTELDPTAGSTRILESESCSLNAFSNTRRNAELQTWLWQWATAKTTSVRLNSALHRDSCTRTYW